MLHLILAVGASILLLLSMILLAAFVGFLIEMGHRIGWWLCVKLEEREKKRLSAFKKT